MSLKLQKVREICLKLFTYQHHGNLIRVTLKNASSYNQIL